MICRVKDQELWNCGCCLCGVRRRRARAVGRHPTEFLARYAILKSTLAAGTLWKLRQQTTCMSGLVIWFSRTRQADSARAASSRLWQSGLGNWSDNSESQGNLKTVAGGDPPFTRVLLLEPLLHEIRVVMVAAEANGLGQVIASQLLCGVQRPSSTAEAASDQGSARQSNFLSVTGVSS